MAKRLLDGIAPPRPLFLPIVFSIGAKVENVPLGTFLSNPTKISSSLRQLRSHLRSDGVACYFDPCLEVEALGATLERVSDDQPPIIHWPLPAKMGDLPQGLCSPEEATKSSRVPVALEVIRRMNSLPQRDFLLMAGVTGPLTLAARILQLAHNEKLRSEDLSDAAQELAAAVLTQMASTFLEAGADVIIMQEEIVPTLSAESCGVWANLLAPAINVVRFYEALPVLQLTAASSVLENWDVISQRQWDCIVCLPVEVVASRKREVSLKTNDAWLGIALPVNAFRSEVSGSNDILETLRPIISALRPAIITTAGDIPHKTDMKRLAKVLGEVSRAI
ncbi:MAG: uroporphyrinogen decarboxylase family protein [Candidatus Acidiferrales bacterium]